MKIKLSFLTVLFLLIGQGCSSFNQSHIYSDLNLSTKSELNAEITVNTNTKLRGSASSTLLFGLLKIGGDSKYSDGYGGLGAVGKTKSAAAFKALSGSDADILVSPQYVVEVNNQIWRKTIRVTVTGYGGKIDRIK